jgi:hypothetical protein
LKWLKNPSMAALSKQVPLRDIDWVSPAPRNVSAGVCGMERDRTLDEDVVFLSFPHESFPGDLAGHDHLEGSDDSVDLQLLGRRRDLGRRHGDDFGPGKAISSRSCAAGKQLLGLSR